MKRVSKSLAIIGSALGFGALCFVIGMNVGGASDLEITVNGLDGRIALYQTSNWSGPEVAEAVCGTHSKLESFHHSYAIIGSGQHFLFSCSQPEKET